MNTLTFEKVFYFVIFGVILAFLAYHALRHLKSIFVLGLKKLDEYVINNTGLDKEDFSVSLPTTPTLYVLNTTLGSAISFKPQDDATIKAYLCTIKNTTNQDAAIQLKMIKDIDGLTNEKGFIVIDLPELNKTDTYSVMIHPITETGKGLPSNVVYAYNKDDDPDAAFIETTSIDDNLDNYNFSVDITKNIY